jgi:hypothetical protein
MTPRYRKTASKGKFLTERDREVIEAVYEARYLTRSQIQQLYFGSATRAKTRLRILFNNGWLRKREVGQNREDVYYLGVKGRHLIEERLKLDREVVAKVSGIAGSGANPLLFLDHELSVSALYVALKLEARGYNWTLTWRNARALEMGNLGVQPDAYFKVTGQQTREAFIEFTAVLPKPSEMKGKIEGYQALWQTLRPIPVLWLTTSRAKLNTLNKSATDGILLGLYEDKGHLLTGTIWHYNGKQVAFLRPKETVLFRAGGRG